MIKYFTNIQPFWEDHLKTHTFARTVPFVARNFNHLDRTFYNKDHLLQSFNQEISNAQQFKDALNVDNGSVTWTCILPNVILPTHEDTFYTMRQEYDVSIEQCYRYLLFLEDWVFGHYVGFEDTSVIHWKAGDVWVFDSTEKHFAVNASNVPFNSCQVSTFN
jgi:hypothetical protein